MRALGIPPDTHRHSRPLGCSATLSWQVTNDIFTREDGEFLVRHGALAAERIRAVETGGCPHAAIREDISINLGPLEDLSRDFSTDLLICESGGGEQGEVVLCTAAAVHSTTGQLLFVEGRLLLLPSGCRPWTDHHVGIGNLCYQALE